MIQLHPEARDELARAAEWYESQQPELGLEFAAEVYRALAVIDTHPEGGQPWTGRRGQALGVRRHVLRRFPFVLPYLVVEDLVVVLAVAHTRRRPGYWLSRAGSTP